MPEYLAPAVYLEEVDTGNKPIEGVSTSTAAMVGVTERGPADVPILITSYGEFTRWFGDRLRRDVFGDHRFLPHAVEGFFTNGGKRVFVVRVVSPQAARALALLFEHAPPVHVPGQPPQVLLRAATERTGTTANPPLVLVLAASGIVANDWLRIGDGSDAEYRRAAAAPVVDTVAVPLSLPFNRTHTNAGGPVTLEQLTLGAALRSFTTINNIGPFEQTIDINAAAAADLTALVAAATPPPLLQIKDGAAANVTEFRFAVQITPLSPTTARIQLDSPLALFYESPATVDHLALPAVAPPPNTANLDGVVRPGESIAMVDDRHANFDTRTDVVLIDRGNNQDRELRRLGELRLVTLGVPAATDYPAASVVEGVTLADDSHIQMNPQTATSIMLVTPATGQELSANQTVLLGTGPNREAAVVQSVASSGLVTLQAPLGFPKNPGDPVTPVRALTSRAPAGQTFLALGNRRGLGRGDLLRVGVAGNEEYVTVTFVPNLGTTGPSPGNVTITPGLAREYPFGTAVVRQNEPARANVQASALVLDTRSGSDAVLVSDGGGGAGTYAANTFIRIWAGWEAYYYRVSQISAAALVPQLIALDIELNRSHPVGSLVIERKRLLEVEALDAGGWGNRLRLSVEEERTGLVRPTTLAHVTNPTHLRLQSAAGVEAGTVLELSDGTGPVGGPVKVAAIDRLTGEITLDGVGLTAAQQVVGLIVRSLEFRLTVRLLRQPDPMTPSRDDTVVDSEVFPYLSMDPRHSRYVVSIVGKINGLPVRRSDHRPDGQSWYVRVRDVATTQVALHGVRLGPERLVDVWANGRQEPARHRLEQRLGDDAILFGGLTDAVYVGIDAVDPEDRTGLQALRNVEEISIVACPGRTTVEIQNALITHCELMRYRFAVLDGPPPPIDALADVQFQRQQFDTKYAALYHPWLIIPDPFPTGVVSLPDYAVPPSGHVLGVYARTDIERGVHKAPANEVVRGIVGLSRVLNKGEHDILNPYPVNINVVRDFRDNNRGIRVYGGRVITSDPDWKYVNVRRLVIFIEQSLERGLQWVVFEPNAEPLWARVRRAIANFLTVVWRNGALEGAKVEEAFFVKCDRTTMTQTDIDSGRLICLVGVAPVKPAEFVIVRIGLWTAHAD